MGNRLEGRVAIVTGAAQGIGATYARALCGEGARVTVADLDDGGSVVEELRAAGGEAIATRADVSDDDSVREMVASTVAAHGRVDILVNNAAVFGKLQAKPFFEIDLDEWDLVMRVNVRGAFQAARAVAPEMRKNGYGRIINVSSGTIFKGAPLYLHYLSSKGAVWAMTRGLARELGEAGITVNTIAPGYTGSESMLANRATWDRIREGMIESRALKRDQFPEDLAGTVVFLASEDSAFMTGQCLLVDGGSAMN